MSEAVFECLKANGLTLDQLDVLVPHQANLRMLEAIVERVGIPRDKVFANVEDYGNIASASLPIAFHEARQSGLIRPGNLVLLVAFGSGFVWGSALLRVQGAVGCNSADAWAAKERKERRDLFAFSAFFRGFLLLRRIRKVQILLACTHQGDSINSLNGL